MLNRYSITADFATNQRRNWICGSCGFCPAGYFDVDSAANRRRNVDAKKALKKRKSINFRCRNVDVRFDEKSILPAVTNDANTFETKFLHKTRRPPYLKNYHTLSCFFFSFFIFNVCIVLH